MIDTIIPYLPYAAWCFGGALAGFGTCAVLTMGKVADSHSGTWIEGYNVGFQDGFHDGDSGQASAHTRCSDALETARNRIERALEQITPGANATVVRIGRILRGEQG